MKALKWIILILVLVTFMGACSFPTATPDESPPLEPGVTATLEPQATSTPQPDVQPTLEPTAALENTPTQEEPDTSGPAPGWGPVSQQGNWVLVSYGDALNPVVVQPGTYATINFSNTDNQVNGSGGCNSYFSSYTADDDGNLTINGPIGSTEMACESGMDQEGLYLNALQTVTGYTLTESSELLLDYDSGAPYAEQLAFVPETALVDTVWVLSAYGDPNNLTLAKPGVVTTAVFSANGTLAGHTGCNNYLAQYNLPGGNQITTSLPATNLAACGIGMQQEQAYLALLDTVQSYRLGVDALEISAADGAVLRFSARHLPLENVVWVLEQMDGQPIPVDVSVYVSFLPAGSPDSQGEQNTASGSAGCNTFFGAYGIEDEKLTIGPFGTTRKMCEESVMLIEQAFLSKLESAISYQVTLDQLVINNAAGSLLFTADRLPLEGPQWILTGSGPVGDPQPPIEGGIFTASFEREFGMPSGTKSGETGCRSYTAAYASGFDQIKVNLPQTASGNCSDAQLQAEQGYFLGLNAAREYRITDRELSVYFDDSVLIFVGNYPAAETGPLTPLDNTRWRLTALGTSSLIPESEIDILYEINPDGRTGRISGSGGCNTYIADITGDFSLSPIISTAASCDTPEGVMDQEGIYLTALQTANDVSVEGSRLTIMTDQDTLFYTVSLPTVEIPTPVPTPGALTAVIIAPTDENVGQTITYDGSLSTPSEDIIAYRWWFTGDEFEDGVSVERTYNKTGAYDAILTVTDVNGNRSEASIKTRIHSYLVGPVWVLEGGGITLSFDGSTLSGNAGCNDYSASYTADTAPGKTNRISVDSITVTQQECDDDIMERETNYLTYLEEAANYAIDLDRLRISPNDAFMTFYK